MKVVLYFPLVESLDKQTSLYILSNVGDQFCCVMQEEKKAITFAGTVKKPGMLTTNPFGIGTMSHICDMQNYLHFEETSK